MDDYMEQCEHYMVRTTFIDYNGPDSTGTKTYTPIREEICRHQNIDQAFGPNDYKKITCEGDSSKCMLSSTPPSEEVERAF